MSQHAHASDRHATYRRLLQRNRFVGLLRIGVPALGVLVLAVLAGQIYLSSLSGQFGIGQITVSDNSISVEAPEYAGTLDDGSAYRVWAQSARAGLATSDIIELNAAALTVTRTNGVVINAEARSAKLDTTNENVIVDGISHIADSTGISGTLYQSVFDWVAQRLTSKGAVKIDYPDGTELEAVGMTYDAAAMVWTFTNATVTLPSTPGADNP
ncbi:hypothetical protein VW29_20380 [Devosia limi DSM 17137]|uniref:Lipopolysaccharide export system protein LptC n=1 Tax=Devosia limi DSM 17137 TaxID=1121477 RepID=A0A0F5L190_9HYPH|nr:hypothetical protein [Devosia limi]KKB76118.1 hypothetical protein VW29_20380 [Devosia limi DSM 17137]SHF22278.1 hypothetical protein SAMN02745223_02112 [Devosia limi DSM 17137]